MAIIIIALTTTILALLFIYTILLVFVLLNYYRGKELEDRINDLEEQHVKVKKKLEVLEKKDSHKWSM